MKQGPLLNLFRYNLFFFELEANYFTILYWFCHTSIWICHRYTHVPHPEPPLPPSSLYHPSGSSQSTCPKHPVSCIEPGLEICFIWYYTCFSAILPNHPTLAFSQSPKDCSIHLCLFCCLVYWVIITIFLNSIYMC